MSSDACAIHDHVIGYLRERLRNTEAQLHERIAELEIQCEYYRARVSQLEAVASSATDDTKSANVASTITAEGEPAEEWPSMDSIVEEEGPAIALSSIKKSGNRRERSRKSVSSNVEGPSTTKAQKTEDPVG